MNMAGSNKRSAYINTERGLIKPIKEARFNEGEVDVIASSEDKNSLIHS